MYMRVYFSARFLHVGVVAAFLLGVTSVAEDSDSFVIRDVRVFDGEQVLDHRNVVVAHGKITQVTKRQLKEPRVEVIDGSGRTLLPGLFDAHVHVSEDVDGSLRQSLVFGVTTVLDMFNAGERLKRIKAAEAADVPGLASVRTAGVGASSPGGHPSQMGGPPFPTITKPEQAEGFVDARIAEGSDFIKIIYDDNAEFGETQRLPALDKATMKAVIDAAHNRRKLAIVHTLTGAASAGCHRGRRRRASSYVYR